MVPSWLKAGYRHFNPALLALVGVFLALLLLRGAAWDGGGADEPVYYSMIAAPIWEGHLDFTRTLLESRNDYFQRLQAALRFFGPSHVDVPFSAGPGMAMSPVLLFGQALDAITGGRLGEHERYAYFYRYLASSATWLAVLLGLIACWAIARRFTTPWRATALCLLLFLGTNLPYYTWDRPLMSHGFSFAAVAFLVLAAMRHAEAPSLWRAFMAGGMVGLAFMMRWQDVLAALIPLTAFVAVWRREGDGMRRLEELGAGLLGAFLFALPQFAMWKVLFGAWITIPQGTSFFVWEWSRLYRVLFSPLNGWLFTHPILIGALGAAAYCAWRRMSWSLAVAAVTLLFIVVNALPGDWWAGGSFGNRRFIGLYALLMIPAGQVAGMLGKRAFAALTGAGALLVWLNLRELFRSSWETIYHPATPGRFLYWDLGQLDVLGWRWVLPGRWFTSDLFAHPPVTDDPATVLVLSSVGTVCVAIVALAIYAIVRRGPGSLACGIITAVYLTLWAGILLLLQIPQEREKIAWANDVREFELSRDYDRIARLEVEAYNRGGDPLRGVPELMLLTGFLLDDRMEEAAEYSRELERRYPRSLLDAWVRHASPSAPQREGWIRRLLRGDDLSPETIRILHLEAAAEGREEERDALRRSLAGPAWKRNLHRLEQEIHAGSSTGRVRDAIERVLDGNPIHLPTRMMGLELSRNDPEEFARHRRVLDAATSRNRALLEYLSSDPAGYAGATFPLLDAQAWYTIRPHLLAGELEEAAAELEFLTPLGLRGSVREQWDEEIRTRRLLAAARAGEEWEPLPEWRHMNPPERPEGAAAVADPQWLLEHDGWSVLEVGDDGTPWRWSLSRAPFMEFDRPLTAGAYTLHVRGFRFPEATEEGYLKFELYGEDARAVTELPQGFFELELALSVPHAIESPVIRLHHPLERVSDFYAGSTDRRMVGMLLYQAWLAPGYPGE